jgi:hypothetical protein
MRCNYFLATFIALALLIAVRAGAQTAPAPPAPVMLPGLWEITVQTRAPVVGPALTHTVCIDKEHAARPDPPKTRRTDDCQVSPDASAANETAYTVRCAKRNLTSTSRFSYSADHFEGAVTINTADAEIHQVYTAIRVGDCDDQVDPVAPPPSN